MTNESIWEPQEFHLFRRETSVAFQEALNLKDRSRTSVLPWRGQFSPQLIELLLQAHPGQQIFDPFCGSGTVLYEAAALGRNATGIDINPAASLLASFSTYCQLPLKARHDLAEVARKVIADATSMCTGDTIGLDISERLPREPFYSCFLLLLFSDKREIPAQRVAAVFEQMRSRLLALPYTTARIQTATGDARHTGYRDESFDLVITSPPYINVFNYHQNYRPIVEALGYTPLSIATAEIGSNRKYRQNRFMTVIQYCIDMEAVFRELWRVLTPKSRALFVVGRSSKVRGVSFHNAALIALVASRSGAFNVSHTYERAFTSRFGELIYEDLMILERTMVMPTEATDVGRSIGAQAVQDAAWSCNDIAVREEIQDAYDRRSTIHRSPRVS